MALTAAEAAGATLYAQPPRPTPSSSAPAPRQPDARAGTWRGAAPNLPLDAVQQAAWGARAVAARSVTVTVDASRRGTLAIATTVTDSRGRAVRSAAAVDEVRFTIDDPTAPASSLTARIGSAERRFLANPNERWTLDDLRLQLRWLPNGKLEVDYRSPSSERSFTATLEPLPASQRSN